MAVLFPGYCCQLLYKTAECLAGRCCPGVCGNISLSVSAPQGPIVSYILYTTLVAASIILKMPNYSDSATLKGVQFPVQTIGEAGTILSIYITFVHRG